MYETAKRSIVLCERRTGVLRTSGVFDGTASHRASAPSRCVMIVAGGLLGIPALGTRTYICTYAGYRKPFLF